MPFTDQDKIECKEIARQIIKEVIIEHITACPHHQAYLITRARVLGIALGLMVASGVSSGTMAAIVVKLFAG